MVRSVKEIAATIVISNMIFLAQEASCISYREMYLDHAVKLMKKTLKEKQGMEYKHIIFDLDGTLIDTEEAILKTWQHTLKEYHYDYPLEELKIVLGITPVKALKLLNTVVKEDFMKRWMKNYSNFNGDVAFFNGVKEMLLTLRQQGYSLGIVTSRNKEEYDNYFRSYNLDLLFDLIIYANDTEKHKPEPEPLYRYMELAKTSSKSCIYIGDMPTDIECANRAGVTSGLIAWNHSGILCPEAKFIFRSPEELCDILLSGSESGK